MAKVPFFGSAKFAPGERSFDFTLLFSPRVSGVGFGRIDDLCWLGAVRRNLPGSIVLTVGFWVLGAISFYIGGTKKYSSSRCVAGGDRCSSYFGEASVPVCWMPVVCPCMF